MEDARPGVAERYAGGSERYVLRSSDLLLLFTIKCMKTYTFLVNLACFFPCLVSAALALKATFLVKG